MFKIIFDQSAKFKLGTFFCVLSFFLLSILTLDIKKRFGYDENHYVSGAKAFLELKEIINLEHPPLGKQLIALGITIFGDNPYGWRMMSVIAGTFTILGMIFLALELFGSHYLALKVGFLSFFSSFILIQSQTAMLDTFALVFLVWSLYFLSKFISSDLSKTRNLIYSSLFAGGLMASKWFGVIYLLSGLIILAIFQFKINRLSLKSINISKEASTQYLRLMMFWIIPLFLIYLVTFLPYNLFEDTKEIYKNFFALQVRMYKHLSLVSRHHQYESHWLTWFMMKVPVCYFYERVGQGNIRAIFSLVNPLVFFGGLVSLFVCLIKIPRDKKDSTIIIVSLFFCFSLCWFFMTRRLAFFYYFFPACLMMPLAIAEAFSRFRRFFNIMFFLSSILFVVYLPITVGLEIPVKYLRYLLWFRS